MLKFWKGFFWLYKAGNPSREVPITDRNLRCVLLLGFRVLYLGVTALRPTWVTALRPPWVAALRPAWVTALRPP